MIYEVEEKYNRFTYQIINNPGEPFGFVEDEFPFEARNIALGKIIQNWKCELQGVNEALKIMQLRAAKIKKNISLIQDFMLNDIASSGLLDPIKCSDIVISTKKNPPKLEITDAELLPDIYRITTQVVTLDNAAIKKDLLDGFEVEGAKITQGRSLVIK